MKQESLNQINADQRQAEVERLKQKIGELLNVVPKRVINGSYQVAVDWKDAAMKDQSACQSKRPQLEKIRSCYAALDGFYAQ